METSAHPARERMKAVGIETDKELAHRAKTYPPVICKWLKGKGTLSKAVSIEVASVLGVDLETVLVTWARWKPRRPRARGRA